MDFKLKFPNFISLLCQNHFLRKQHIGLFDSKKKKNSKKPTKLRLFSLILQVSQRCYRVISGCLLQMWINVVSRAQYVCHKSIKVPVRPGCISVFLEISQRNLGQHFNLPSADETGAGTAQKSRFLLCLNKKIAVWLHLWRWFSLAASFSLRIMEKRSVWKRL